MSATLVAQILSGLTVSLGLALILLRHWLNAFPVLRWAIVALMVASGLTLVLAPFVLLPEQLQGPKSVTFENQLNRDLTIYLDGKVDASLSAKKTTAITMLILGPDTLQDLEARDPTGEVVYRQQISGRILRSQGWRIVIGPSSGAPQTRYGKHIRDSALVSTPTKTLVA